MKTNNPIRFAFPEKIKSSPSSLAHWQHLVLFEKAKNAEFWEHWSGIGGLWGGEKKGKNYAGHLTPPVEEMGRNRKRGRSEEKPSAAP